MDIKCSNCGQFFDDRDKFCRYCGCPNAVAEEKQKEKVVPKLSKRAIEDKIQEEKTIVVEEDILGASEIDYSQIKVKRKGELFSLRIKSIFVMAFAVLFSIAGVAGAIVIKNLSGNAVLRTLGIVVSITAIFFGLAVAVGRYFMIMTYSTIKEKNIVVPKYGLKKTPIFMLGGFVFEMDVHKVCPICDGKIKGDLHIEKIQGRAVAVCNFNRKHIFSIGENSFFQYYLNGVESSLNKKDSQNQSQGIADAIEASTDNLEACQCQDVDQDNNVNHQDEANVIAPDTIGEDTLLEENACVEADIKVNEDVDNGNNEKTLKASDEITACKTTKSDNIKKEKTTNKVNN